MHCILIFIGEHFLIFLYTITTFSRLIYLALPKVEPSMQLIFYVYQRTGAQDLKVKFDIRRGNSPSDFYVLHSIWKVVKMNCRERESERGGGGEKEREREREMRLSSANGVYVFLSFYFLRPPKIAGAWPSPFFRAKLARAWKVCGGESRW